MASCERADGSDMVRWKWEREKERRVEILEKELIQKCFKLKQGTGRRYRRYEERNAFWKKDDRAIKSINNSQLNYFACKHLSYVKMLFVLCFCVLCCLIFFVRT